MSWGIAQAPPKKRNPCRIPQECRKTLQLFPIFFSTLLVISNLYGVYIPSIIFITRDQKGITSRGCKLFTRGPCLSKQREQFFYFNRLYGGRNITICDICTANLLSCAGDFGGAIYTSRSISKYIAVTNKHTPQADCHYYTPFTPVSITTSLLPHCRQCAGSWKRSDDGAL